jgi:hypothetical protein
MLSLEKGPGPFLYFLFSFFIEKAEEYLKESGKFNKIIGNENIIARKIYGCF